LNAKRGIRLNGKPIAGCSLAELYAHHYSDTVNMVNAPYLAKNRQPRRSIRHTAIRGVQHADPRFSGDGSGYAIQLRSTLVFAAKIRRD
jgi:hypothetical protein